MATEQNAPDSGYSQALLQGLSNLKDQNELCDVTIKIGGRAFHAHRAILAATSNYFRAMFTSGFKECNEREIKIEGNAEAFELLLNFAYTGILDKTQLMDHVYDVFEMSCYMQCTEFAKVCAEFIIYNFKSKTETISVGDALATSVLARNYGHDELFEVSDKFWKTI